MLTKNVFKIAFIMAQLGLAAPALADSAPFDKGWTLSEVGSNLHFISVKKGTVMESSRFATLAGSIDEDGKATFEVALDSVDTSVDLRNVRMRFLLFETFLHPKATVTAQLTEGMLDGLKDAGSIDMTLPITLDLHGVTQTLDAEVIVTLMGDNRVSVAASSPVILKLGDFELMDGREKLQDAAEVEIVPATSVLFHLVFDRNGTREGVAVASADIEARPALEPEGSLSNEACKGRFEILSRSGNINFQAGSAELTSDSTPLLRDVAQIIGKCPDMIIQVAGHTDSRGDKAYNLWLSVQRSQSVVDFLQAQGVPADRLQSKGYGEMRPIASNRTNNGRLANRRIEFSVNGFSNGS